MFAQDFEVNLQTKEDVIDYKIQILYDLRILKPVYPYTVISSGDDREYNVRKALKQCKTYEEMSRRLHSLIREDETIDEFCVRYPL